MQGIKGPVNRLRLFLHPPNRLANLVGRGDHLFQILQRCAPCSLFILKSNCRLSFSFLSKPRMCCGEILPMSNIAYYSACRLGTTKRHRGSAVMKFQPLSAHFHVLPSVVLWSPTLQGTARTKASNMKRQFSARWKCAYLTSLLAPCFLPMLILRYTNNIGMLAIKPAPLTCMRTMVRET